MARCVRHRRQFAVEARLGEGALTCLQPSDLLTSLTARHLGKSLNLARSARCEDERGPRGPAASGCGRSGACWAAIAVELALNRKCRPSWQCRKLALPATTRPDDDSSVDMRSASRGSSARIDWNRAGAPDTRYSWSSASPAIRETAAPRCATPARPDREMPLFSWPSSQQLRPVGSEIG